MTGLKIKRRTAILPQDQLNMEESFLAPCKTMYFGQGASCTPTSHGQHLAESRWEEGLHKRLPERVREHGQDGSRRAGLRGPGPHSHASREATAGLSCVGPPRRPHFPSAETELGERKAGVTAEHREL